MADKHITDLTELGSGQIASGDYFIVVDVSDTTEASTGTTKKIDADNIAELKISSYGLTIIDDGNASTAQDTLGLSALAKTLIDDTTATAFLTTLGLDTDLLTLSLPASVDIDAFAKTLLDDTDKTTFKATLEADGLETTWTYTSEQDCSAGTETDIAVATGLPAGILEFDVFVNYVSVDAANVPPRIQLGTGAGPSYKTSGYECNAWGLINTNANESTYTSSFVISHSDIWVNAIATYEVVRFKRWDASEHTWFAYGTGNLGTTRIGGMVGIVTLSAELTAVKIQTNGVAKFNGGGVSMRYR